MANKKKEHFTFIGKIFSVILGIIDVISFLGITSTVCFALIKKHYMLFIITGVIIVLAIIAHKIGKNNKKFIKHIVNLFATNTPYRFVNQELVYEYKSDTEMTFDTTYDVKALQTGVDRILVKINWSGATEANPIKPVPRTDGNFQTKEISPARDYFGYNNYQVIAKNSINKNDDPIKLGYHIDMKKTTKEVSHHLLSTVSVRTDKLVMKVLLPYKIYPSNIKCLEYLHSTDENHWDVKEPSNQPIIIENSSKWLIEWDIDKPIFGGKYLITWNPDLKP